MGHQFHRFEQRFGELPVWGAELMAQTDPDGNLLTVNGAYFPTPRKLPNDPAIDRSGAIDLARLAAGVASMPQEADSRLVVYAEASRPARLAWEVQLPQSMVEDWLVLIDASNGRTLKSFNQVATTSVAASGQDLFGQTQDLNAWLDDGAYYLADASKPMFDSGYDPLTGNPESGAILVADWGNAPTDAGTPAIVESIQAAGPWLADGVSAAANLSHAYDYFLSEHGRDSLDGLGSSLTAIVRYGTGYTNAQFNSDLQIMVFGDAEPFAGALDVVGHELSHGVTHTSAGLVYHGQSGALNEAFSDVFGEMIEAHVHGQPDWVVGSVLSGGLRDMSQPERFGQPSRMSDYVVTGLDHGGVHINSGIVNHAFYLLAEGLPEAIGIDAAAAIFYRALTTSLLTRSEFLDARVACIQAAEQLYGPGSAQALRTAEAFDAVEIYDSPANPMPGPLEPVDAPDSTIFTFLDSGSGEHYLGRREDELGDPVQGSYLSASPVSLKRPSVSRDGEIAAYVDSQNDVCLIATGVPGSEECIGYPGLTYSIAMSSDGDSFGVIFQDGAGNAENTINIINIATEETRTVPLVAPVLDGESNVEVLQADAMDFTSDSRFLIYDAFNEVEYADGATLGSWSIYAYDQLTDSTLVLIPPRHGLDIAYPVVAKTSDFRIAFDVWDEASGESTIVVADLLSGDVEATGASGTYGVPAFTGDDGAIVYTDLDAATSTGGSMYVQEIGGENGMTPVGSRTTYVADAAYGTTYRRGAPDDASAVDLSLTSSMVEESVLRAVEPLNFTVKNEGDGEASAVTVTINVPGAAESGGGSSSCSADGNKVTCALESLAPDEDVELGWSFEFGSRETMQFGLSVVAEQSDVDTENNSSFAEVAVVNVPPGRISAVADITVDEGDTVSADLATYFEDPDGDALVFSATGLPAGVTMSPAGTLSGSVADVAADTTYDVTVEAADPYDDTATATFTLAVEDVPQSSGGSGTAGGGGGGGGASGLVWTLLLVPYLMRRRRAHDLELELAELR